MAPSSLKEMNRCSFGKLKACGAHFLIDPPTSPLTCVKYEVSSLGAGGGMEVKVTDVGLVGLLQGVSGGYKASPGHGEVGREAQRLP